MCVGVRGRGHVTEMYFYIEMRVIVFLFNTVNSRNLKAEVHLRLLIFQSNFSGPKQFALRCQSAV